MLLTMYLHDKTDHAGRYSVVAESEADGGSRILSVIKKYA